VSTSARIILQSRHTAYLKIVCKAVAKTAESASEFLEKWSRSEEFKNMERSQRVRYLCEIGLERMNA
jgi:hypothetical protein